MSAHWPVNRVTGRGMVGIVSDCFPSMAGDSSPAPGLHLLVADSNGLDRGVAVLLLLDDVPLDGPDRVGRGEDLFKVDRAYSQLLTVLQVQERYAGSVVPDELPRGIARVVNPEDVDLGDEVPRLGGPKDPVKGGAPVEDLEFGVVVVEPEADAERSQGLADLAQLLADPLAG